MRLNVVDSFTDRMTSMRLRPLLLVLVVAVVACGETALLDRSSTTAAIDDETTAVQEGAETVNHETRPVWSGFHATHQQPQTLAAYSHGELDVYTRPDGSELLLTLDQTTILGTVTVLGVISGPDNGWVEVMLPIRPNGSTGWVRSRDVSLYVADSTIVIDLDKRRLTYLVGGVELLSTAVGIGSRYNPTPTGVFFVTDSVSLSDPDSPWGPYALGLSARSETITEFNGGDGIIGIHGTNNPSSIGDDISLGCVRLPNDVISQLHAMVPLGTRVEIRA